MSVYWKENADYLRESIESLLSQTRPADEIVVVKDGPLTPELEAVLADYPQLVIVPLPENVGLGRALNAGLEHCTHNLVARMDSDDVCKPQRFERQLTFMEAHPEVAISSAWIDEFVDSIDNVVSSRRLPETHEDLVEYARGRCPMNHPVVMFRRDAVLSAGGYRHFPLYEDYYLWVRLIAGGYRLHNLQESLLWFRTSPDMYRRRGGWKYAVGSVHFQNKLYEMGLQTRFGAMKQSLIRGTVFLMPNGMRAWVYCHLLR